VIKLAGAEESRGLKMELSKSHIVAKLMITIQKKICKKAQHLNQGEGEEEEEEEGGAGELIQLLLVNKFFFYSYKSEKNAFVESFMGLIHMNYLRKEKKYKQKKKM
jgi:hypothetical protein